MSSKQLNKIFSTIYVEKDVISSKKTKEILNHFPKAEIIEINSYQEIFNRNRQDFRVQKQSQKLILAKKTDSLIYDGSSFTPNFEHEHYYYNAMAINCIYDCSYCYLQGMFRSANLLIFVNIDDFINAALEKLKTYSELYLSISYDTDMLAIEHLTSYCKEWIEVCRKNPDLLVESRTKSANYNSIKDLAPTKNFILAWTLSPEEIRKEFEKLTPSLNAKIKAINSALVDGWNVRICMDPLLYIPEWEKTYKNFIEKIQSEIDLKKVKDFSLGTFRMNEDYFKKVKKLRPKEWLVNFPYQTEKEIVNYKDSQIENLESLIIERLVSSGVNQEAIFCF